VDGEEQDRQLAEPEGGQGIAEQHTEAGPGIERTVGPPGHDNSELTSYRTIVELIGATTTTKGSAHQGRTGHRVDPTGVKISDAELGALPLTRHDWHYHPTPGCSINFAVSP